MVKKLRFMLLFLLGMMIPLTSLAYDVEVGGIYYNLDDGTQSATVTYKAHDSRTYSGDITIPSSMYWGGKFYTVRGIGYQSFLNCMQLTSLEIPNTVTSIGDMAFFNCESLTSITIPNSVTNIGAHAFSDCSSLTSIFIPSSVTSIGHSPFNGCSLISITVDPENTAFDSRENCNAIIRKSDNTLIQGCQTTIIPNSVTTIGEEAFYDCYSLASIVIPNSVTSIEEGAFMGCFNMSSITIPSSVTSIGHRVFNLCRSLTSIIIPNSVTSIGISLLNGASSLTSVELPNSITNIGNYFFSKCSSLTSIILPQNVVRVGEYAFYNCTSLTSVVCEAVNPPICDASAFNCDRSSATLYVPEISVEAYRNTSPWSSFGTFETIATPTPPERTITISDLGTATYCCEYDLDFRGIEGIKAYVATGFNYNSGSVLLTRVHEIPSGTGFMVMGVAGSHEIPTAEVKYAYANLFVGTTAETALPGSDGGYSNYILANGTEGLKFYRSDGTSPLPANRAYLHIPTNITSDSRTLSFSFAEDSEVTGIDDVVDSGSDVQAHTYNLSGQRVVSTKSGVYVKNGKIVIIK